MSDLVNVASLAILDPRASDPGIDFAVLVAPLSAERPTGEDLRYEGTFDRIDEARREDDPSVPQGIWQTPLKRADWRAVRDQCLEVLETRSKDLQVAAWLTESLLHLHGFRGVAAGLRVMRDLCITFWTELHPAIEDGDVEFRVAPIHWLNEKLTLKIQRIPLTDPSVTDAPRGSWADWAGALRIENLAGRQRGIMAEAEAEGRLTRMRFMTSVAVTPVEFYVGLTRAVADALEAAASLERFLDQKCGRQGPSLSRLRTALDDINRLVVGFLTDKGGATAEEQTMADVRDDERTAGTVTAPPGDHPPAVGRLSGIRNREDAYLRLAEAAEYLLRTEPHSPVPYLVKRAVSWGSKPLDELLQELINDRGEVRQLMSLLGMPEERGSR